MSAISSPVRTPCRRVVSSGASAAFPGLVVNRTSRPALLTTAMSLVVSPPRLRPIACRSADSSRGQPLFLRQRRADGPCQRFRRPSRPSGRGPPRSRRRFAGRRPIAPSGGSTGAQPSCLRTPWAGPFMVQPLHGEPVQPRTINGRPFDMLRANGPTGQRKKLPSIPMSLFGSVCYCRIGKPPNGNIRPDLLVTQVFVQPRRPWDKLGYLPGLRREHRQVLMHQHHDTLGERIPPACWRVAVAVVKGRVGPPPSAPVKHSRPDATVGVEFVGVLLPECGRR